MIYCTTGKLGEGMTLHRRLRNQTQWISIAEFLTVDPLVKLGLVGGWSTGAAGTAATGGKRSAPGAGGSAIPHGNHGDNLQATQVDPS